MEKFNRAIQDEAGNKVTTATVTVYDAGTLNVSSLFDDDEVTPLSNPFTSADLNYDSDGTFWFKAANGDYDIKVVTSSGTAWLYDVTMLDISEQAIYFQDGTAAAPSVVFAADLDTGLFRKATNSIGLSVGGSEVFAVDASKNIGFGGTANAWSKNHVLQIEDGGALFNEDANSLCLTGNAYNDGAWKRIQAGFPVKLDINYSTGSFKVSGQNSSDAADSAISFSTLFEVQNNGSVIFGNAAIPTTATFGFPYIPTCAGVPTGTPEVKTGRTPIVYDSVGKDLYIWNGAAWENAEAQAWGTISGTLSNQTDLQSALDGKSDTSHAHAGVYEPAFSKNTAFNKNFGTGAGTVSEGNHNHSGVYEPAFAKNTAFNKNFGTGGTDVATGNHLHAIYAPLASPNLSGNPTAPTPSPGDNDTSIATTAFVQNAIGGGLSMAIYQYSVSAGSVGGSATTASWTTRPLNTEFSDPDGIGSLASNQITLQAGTYKIDGYMTVHRTGQSACRIYNVTDTAVVNTGEAQESESNQYIGQMLHVTGLVTITAAKAFALQYYCVGNVGTTSLGGRATNMGVNNVWATVVITKLS